MHNAKLQGMVKGWFVGGFEPTLFKTNDVEVAVKEYKKGDKVIVISGKDKGSIGTIQKVFPKENRVIVDGVNVCKKHVKPNQMNPEGSIQEIFAPIDASNVMFYDEKSKKGTRLGYKEDKDGKKVRFMKSSKKEVK